jgi:hypothetical protein
MKDFEAQLLAPISKGGVFHAWVGKRFLVDGGIHSEELKTMFYSKFDPLWSNFLFVFLPMFKFLCKSGIELSMTYIVGFVDI